MKLLIPMDFSLVSANAFKYAYNMYPKAQITCLYCMEANMNHRETPGLNTPESKLNLLSLELKNLVKDVIGRENLPESISFRIVPGEAVSVITNMAKTFKPNYIFMGTRDKYDLMDRWIGTVSLGVVKSCNYPTYLIPKHSKYDSINKALVATDSHMKNPKLIHWLKIWNKKYNSFIKFLYVQRSEKRELEAISEGIISNLFEEDDVEFSFEIENVKSKDLVEALLAQAYNLGADLIIAAPDRQSLVQSILYKSVSKELILKSKIPLLFLKFYYRD